jgi:RNA ligase (TIGR02306 family)
MSTFNVTVHRIEILPHPYADALELAKVGEYLAVVQKAKHFTGELVAYIPEASVVPEEIQKELGLEGKLSGSDKNRVKAIKLRGILSQGLIYPARPHWKLGDDVTEELGITKYEPVVPIHLSGQVANVGHEFAFNYDIENFKKEPHIIEKGEKVIFTEKIHGTNCRITVVPEHMSHPECGRLFVASKGHGKQGLVYKDSEENVKNVYLKIAKSLDMVNLLDSFVTEKYNAPISVWGEVFGKGIQDLNYDSPLSFRVFDVYVGIVNKGYFLNFDDLVSFCNDTKLEMVPVLYCGPFNRDVLELHTNGKETVSGKESHIREGVVIRPVMEREHNNLPMNRIQLKNISADYLLRKGEATEYT